MLARHLGILFAHSSSDPAVIDFGCGNGFYVQHLNSMGIPTIGFDGRPQLAPNCHHLDLAVEFDLGYKADWVISLEVGEHIPAEHQSTFLDNICNPCLYGLVLSWAKPNQPGRGHVNCQPQDKIIEEVVGRGFRYDVQMTRALRNTELPWLKYNLLAFIRISSFRSVLTLES